MRDLSTITDKVTSILVSTNPSFQVTKVFLQVFFVSGERSRQLVLARLELPRVVHERFLHSEKVIVRI